MPTCCVAGCTSGYRANKTSRHSFWAPRDPDLRAAWDRAIPRRDRKLSDKSRLCDLHFQPEDILKTYTHIIDGKKGEIARGKWSLAEGSQPKVFPNLPTYLSKPPVKKRKLPDRERPRPDTSARKKDRTDLTRVSEECASNFDVPVTNDVPTMTDIEEVSLPSSSWRKMMQHDSTGSYVAFFELKAEEKVLLVEKCVIVGNDMSVTVSSRGRVAKSCRAVSTVLQLAELLASIHQLKVCSGCPNACAGTPLNERRSTKCEVLTVHPNCGSCLRLSLKLSQKWAKQQLRLKQQKQKLDILQKRALRAAVRRSKLLGSVKELKTKLAAEPSNSLKEALSVLSPIQQKAFESSLKQVKAKKPQGMRYSSTWIMNCLLLRIASPKAYKLIRSMKLLALPTCSRLNQILAGMPCEYGFNKVALEAIQAYFNSKPGSSNYGTLLIDEMKLRESVECNPSTYKFDGFVDFSGTAPEANGKLADHALVVMFVPIFESWVQPVASFATKGAAPGVALAKMVLESVLQLEHHGVSVVAVVSDGAGNNRSM